MTMREIGEKVYLNPYYNTTGTIIDRKVDNCDQIPDGFDYKVKWNQQMEIGIGEWEFYSGEKLDLLESNWHMVMNN